MAKQTLRWAHKISVCRVSGNTCNFFLPYDWRKHIDSEYLYLPDFDDSLLSNGRETSTGILCFVCITAVSPLAGLKQSIPTI
jgi:hypothetical protein